MTVLIFRRVTMRRFLKWLALSVLTLLLVVPLLYFITLGEGDAALYPAASGQENFTIYLADHGHHAGVVVRRADIERFAGSVGGDVLPAVASRFWEYDWIEIGWGDEQFYRFAPTLSHVTVTMALSALSGMNDKTVLHVVGLKASPETIFRHSDLQRIDLSEGGMERMLAGVSASFSVDGTGAPEELGKGIYGPSLFYRANGRYSLLNTCNHWLGRLVASAGLKVSPVAAVTSRGLMAELRWRNILPPQSVSIASPSP